MTRQDRINKLQRIQRVAQELISDYLIREETLDSVAADNARNNATSLKVVCDIAGELLTLEAKERKEFKTCRLSRPTGVRQPVAENVPQRWRNADLRVFAKQNGVRMWEIAECLCVSEATLTRWMRSELDPDIEANIRNAIATIIAER